MSLEINEIRIHDVTVVQLRGRVALGQENQRIEALVDDIEGRRQTKVVFDLTGVDYLDSSAIGMLAQVSGKLKESGGKLVLVAPPAGRTAQLLKLTQMNAIVPVYTSLDEARAALA